MTIFWRRRFVEVLFVFFCLKFIALSLQILGLVIVTTTAFGNVDLIENWAIALDLLPSNIHLFIFDMIMSGLSLLISYTWLNKLLAAKQKRFKRFPGNNAFFAIFIVFFAFSSHWALSVVLFILFILAKKQQKKPATKKIQTISYS